MNRSLVGVTLDELNGEFCLQMIVKKGEACELLISIGDNLEEATRGLDEQIVEHYIKSFQFHSKEKLKKFLLNESTMSTSI